MPAPGQPTIGQPAIVQPAIGQPTIGQPTIVQPALRQLEPHLSSNWRDLDFAIQDAARESTIRQADVPRTASPSDQVTYESQMNEGQFAIAPNELSFFDGIRMPPLSPIRSDESIGDTVVLINHQKVISSLVTRVSYKVNRNTLSVNKDVFSLCLSSERQTGLITILDLRFMLYGLAISRRQFRVDNQRPVLHGIVLARPKLELLIMHNAYIIKEQKCAGI